MTQPDRFVLQHEPTPQALASSVVLLRRLAGPDAPETSRMMYRLIEACEKDGVIDQERVVRLCEEADHFLDGRDSNTPIEPDTYYEIGFLYTGKFKDGGDPPIKLRDLDMFRLPVDTEGHPLHDKRELDEFSAMGQAQGFDAYPVKWVRGFAYYTVVHQEARLNLPPKRPGFKLYTMLDLFRKPVRWENGKEEGVQA